MLGKTVGVTSFAWLAIKLGLGRMPHRTTWRHIIGLAMLAGIGFTVALFVASLAFEVPEGGAEAAAVASQQASAKIGIFLGSLVAGIGGFLFLRSGGEDEPHHRPAGDAEPAAAAVSAGA